MQGRSSPARSAAHGCPWSRATGSGGVNPAPCVSVYTAQMEPVVTTRWAPNAVEQTREIEDFDAVVRAVLAQSLSFRPGFPKRPGCLRIPGAGVFPEGLPGASEVSWRGQSKYLADADCGQSRAVAAVWSVVKTLSERQRTVFLLRFVEDLDLLEIAEVTGLREGTVKVHLFRALEAVRKRMGESQ